MSFQNESTIHGRLLHESRTNTSTDECIIRRHGRAPRPSLTEVIKNISKLAEFFVIIVWFATNFRITI
jgi:hypothetical protein